MYVIEQRTQTSCYTILTQCCLTRAPVLGHGTLRILQIAMLTRRSEKFNLVSLL